jgi:hypothetical protein
MNNFVKQQQLNGWKDDLNRIEYAREKLNRDQGMMTPYERQAHAESLHDEIRMVYPKIYKGLKSNLDVAIHKYQNTKINTAKAKADEINSWDTAKLDSEMNFFRSLVKSALDNPGNPLAGIPGPAKRIEMLYEEAVASQNPVKIRAAAEVLNGLPPLTKLPKDEAIGIRMTARDAAILTDTIRKTDHIMAAEKSEAEAAIELIETRESVHDAAAILGESTRNPFDDGSLAKLVKTVQIGPDGTVKVFNLDDPEVTGISWNAVDWDQVRKDQEGQSWER